MISGDQYSVDMNTRFKFPILRSDLCDYSDAYIIVCSSSYYLLWLHKTSQNKKVLTLSI